MDDTLPNPDAALRNLPDALKPPLIRSHEPQLDSGQQQVLSSWALGPSLMGRPQTLLLTPSVLKSLAKTAQRNSLGWCGSSQTAILMRAGILTRWKSLRIQNEIPYKSNSSVGVCELLSLGRLDKRPRLLSATLGKGSAWGYHFEYFTLFSSLNKSRLD